MKTINLRNYEKYQQTHVACLIYKIRHCMEKFQRVVLMLLMKSYFIGKPYDFKGPTQDFVGKP